MIEIKTARFVKYDKDTKRVSILLLTEENEGLQFDVLIGLPEIMTRETMDEVIQMNKALAGRFDEDDEIDMQKIDREKMDKFFEEVIQMVIQGRKKGALEVPISTELDETGEVD